MKLKLSCDSRFQRAFTACVYVVKVITLIGSNQRNYFENANACSKRTLKKQLSQLSLNVPITFWPNLTKINGKNHLLIGKTFGWS